MNIGMICSVLLFSKVEMHRPTCVETAEESVFATDSIRVLMPFLMLNCELRGIYNALLQDFLKEYWELPIALRQYSAIALSVVRQASTACCTDMWRPSWA